MPSTLSARLTVLALLVTHVGAAAQSGDGFGLAMTGLELSLDLDYDDGSLSGWARYEITNLSDGPAVEVPFNVGRLMRVQGADGPQGNALGFTQDVVVFEDSPRRQVNHVVVTLSRALAPGEATSVRVRYGGYLVGYTETGSLYIQDRVDEAFSILREDAFAWPVLGTLDRRRNRVAPRPDFPFTARVTVPDHLTVASGGRLVERTAEGGRATFVYESTAPVPFLNLPVAEYSVLRQGGLRVYHFPQDSVGARRLMDRTSASLALLERWYGPLGSAPELAVMEIPDMWGSQASLTGGIIQTADAFREAGGVSALYHELSHLWNVQDLDRPSPRWNEGLATFLSLRMAAELDGSEGMDRAVARTAQRLLGAASTTPQIASVSFAEYGEAGVTDLSYQVGFLMFYALHRKLGDAAFDGALRRYIEDHRDGGGTFGGLLRYFQAESDDDLGPFFRAWVHTTDWLDQLRAGTRVEDVGQGNSDDGLSSSTGRRASGTTAGTRDPSAGARDSRAGRARR